MGANHNVNGTVGKARLDLGGVRGRSEAGQLCDLDGVSGIAFSKGVVVLLCKQRRGHEDRNLLPILNGLKCSTHSDLGLAVANVAGQKPVHWDPLLHIRLHLIDCRQLIRGFRVLKGVFKLALPRRVRSESVPFRLCTFRVEAHELRGDLHNRLAGLLLSLCPVSPTHLG